MCRTTTFRGWLSLCLLATACSANFDGGSGAGGAGGSSGAPDAGDGPMGRLVVESMPSVRLTPGSEAAVVVRYVDDAEQPVPGVAVSFALVGHAQDSGLSALNVTTNTLGRATTRLVAGTLSASFRVRASAQGAEPVVVDVAVSDRGFGNLRVLAPYAGQRVVAQRRVALFASQQCADVTVDTVADRQVMLSSLTEDARFIGLPAQASFSVLVVALGTGGEPLAEGCVDGATVVADTDTSVTVTWTDARLTPWGAYEVSVVADATEAGQWLAERVRNDTAPEPPAELPTAAELLLQALEDVLRADPEALTKLDAADALALLRADDTANLELEAALDAAEAGPAALRTSLADGLIDALSSVRMDAIAQLHADDLSGDLDDAQGTLDWTLHAAFALGSQYAPVEYLVASPVAARVATSFMWDDDKCSWTVGMPSVWGGLATEIIDAQLGDTDPLRRQAALQRLGCMALDSWVATVAVIDSACDGDCITAACDTVLANLVVSLQASLLAADLARPITELHVTALMTDDGGDGGVDAFSSDAGEVRWLADEADPNAEDTLMSATVSAVREPVGPMP